MKMKRISFLLVALMVLSLFGMPMNSYAATSDAKLILKAPTAIAGGSTVNLDVYIDNTTATGDTSGVCSAKVSIVYDADNFSIPLGVTSSAIQKGADAPSAWTIQEFEQTPGTTTPGYITLIVGDPNYTENIQTTNAEKHIARLTFTADSAIPVETYDFTISQDKVATGLTTCDENLFGGDGTVPANYTLSYEDASTTVASAYAVTYNENGSTSGSVPTDANSPYVQSATVTVLGNTGSLARTGYSFAGWNTAANGSGTSYAAGNTFTMGTAPVTLYAVWVSSAPELGFVPGSKFWITTFSDKNYKDAGDISAETTYSSIRFGEYVNIKADEFKAQMIVTGGSIKIFDGSSTDITDSTSAYIGSTCTVALYDTLNNLAKTYLVTLKGDVNGDGFILTPDVVLLRKYTVNTSVLTMAQKYAGDINKDGYVLTPDVVLLRKFTVNTGTIDQTN